MNETIDPTRIFTRHQIENLLGATIGKTLLQVDKAQLFAHHDGRDKVKGIADNITEESHNKKMPVMRAIVFPEFTQRIPVIVYIVRNANSAMPSVIFQPASNTRGTL